MIGAQQNEFDYPTGESDTEGSIGTETRWTGTTGIPLDKTLMRLLFAARFRDLDLLISDQVTANSQLLFHRSLSDRLSMVAPFLRFDKDPYLVIDDSGRLVYIQDAYTTSDRFPNAQATDPGGTSGLGNDAFNYIRNSVKITIDAYDGTMHFYVATRTTRSSAPTKASSRPCSSRCRRCRPTCRRTCGSPRTCSTSRPTCSGAIT